MLNVDAQSSATPEGIMAEEQRDQASQLLGQEDSPNSSLPPVAEDGLLKRLEDAGRKLLGAFGTEDKGQVDLAETDPLIAELYENGIDSDFKQASKIGDCYLLAALKSLKGHKVLMREVFTKTVHQIKPGEWKVNFLGLDIKPITVTDEIIETWKEAHEGMQAAKGDIILEVAYASAKSRIKEGKRGRTMIKNYRGDLALEGGYGHRALFDLMGPLVNKHKIADYETREGDSSLVQNGHAAESTSFFEDRFSSGEYIVTANTPRKSKLTFDPFRLFKGVKVLHNRHAYAVIGYDIRSRKVELANPHDTSQRFKLSLDAFNSKFSQIAYVKINPLAYALSVLSQNTNSDTIERAIDTALQQHGNIYDLCGAQQNNTGQLKDILDYLIYHYHHNSILQLSIYNKLLLPARQVGVELNSPIAKELEVKRVRRNYCQIWEGPIIEPFKEGEIPKGGERNFKYTKPFSIYLGKESGVHLKVTRSESGEFGITGNDGTGWKFLDTLSSWSQTTIGREADISLNNETVSSHHVTLTIKEDVITVKDSNSTNGTSLGRG